MKKFRLLVGIAGCVALMASGAAAAEVLSQNVVGYYNIPIEQGLNLVAFPFQKIPAARGAVSANTDTTITDDGATWDAGFFDQGAVGSEPTGESTFYVEITSGAFEGRHMYIVSNTDNTLTITGGVPADIAADELVGAGYKIVAANRIRDLFGEPGAPLLDGANDVADADTILMWDRTNLRWGGATFYKTGGFPVLNRQNWNRDGEFANDDVVDRDAGVFIRRRSQDPVSVTIVGEVSDNAQQIVFQSGLNLIGGLSVIDEPIGSTLLYPDALVGANDVADADTILAWGGNNWEGAVFYKTGGFPLNLRNHWIRGDEIVDDNFAFVPTKGYFIRVRGTTPLGPWVRPSPLAQ